MTKQFVLGSADWLKLQREGFYDRRPPVPAEPRRATEYDEALIFDAAARAFRTGSERSHYKRPPNRTVERGAGKPCTYCKRKMVPYTGTHPTRDHVIPKSKGGRATVWCCTKCNGAKGDMMPHEWERFMREFPEWWVVPGREAQGRRVIMAARRGVVGAPKVDADTKPQAVSGAPTRKRRRRQIIPLAPPTLALRGGYWLEK